MGRNNDNQKKAVSGAKKFTISQLKKWKINYDQIFFGKPSSDFYIDDKALNVFDWLNGKNHNGPTLKYPIAEVADRYTICKLKHERIEAEDLSRQLAVLKAELDRYPGIETFISRLYKINGECWDMESEIRRGKEGILGLEEVGKRTLTLRDKNKIRVGIKEKRDEEKCKVSQK